jgi:ABC-type Na+ efflux pump permease subunit
MKIRKNLLTLGFALTLFFSLSMLTYATEETEPIATGFVEVTATVPSGFTNSLALNLKHENGASYTITVDAENEYKAKEEVESGLYTTLVDIVTGGDEVYCPTCIGEKNHTLKYAAFLVVERNRDNPFEIRIIESENEKSVEEMEPEKEQDAIENEQEAVTENNSTQEEKSSLEEVKSPETKQQVESDTEETEKRPSLGREFLKKNLFSFFLLIVLCFISIIIKVKNEL